MIRKRRADNFRRLWLPYNEDPRGISLDVRMPHQYGSNSTKPGNVVAVVREYEWVCFAPPKPSLQPCYEMSVHIVAKFISAVCLALELDFPRMLQQ